MHKRHSVRSSLSKAKSKNALRNFHLSVKLAICMQLEEKPGSACHSRCCCRKCERDRYRYDALLLARCLLWHVPHIRTNGHEGWESFYLGKNHVDRIGRFQAIIDYSDMAPVLQKANEIGYFELNGVYDNEGIQDLPNIITAIANNGKLHRVRNRYKGPAALRMLYIELDTLIAKQTWTPVTVIKQD